MEAGEHLTGNFRVRAIFPSFDDANRLFEKVRDKMEVRRHALKLRYWPEANPTDQSGKVLDLDWSWIKALPNLHVGELRIHDTIGGKDNLRIIFFQGDRVDDDPMPTVWILRVLQKKRNDFSSHDLRIFKARRTLVLERFYRNPLHK